MATAKGAKSAKVILEAEDQTAKAFAQIERRLASTDRKMRKMSKTRPFEGIEAAKSFAGPERSLEEIWKNAKGGAGAVSKLYRGLSKLGAVGAAVGGLAAATGVAVAVWDKAAVKLNEMATATANLQISIDGASAAFGGLANEAQLAQAANRAFTLGVAQNGAEFAALAAGVSVIARKLGDDQMQLLEDAVSGIGRRSSAILDNLAIVMTAKDAEEEYARMLGKSTDQLTAYEKAVSFQKVAVLKIAKEAGIATLSQAQAEEVYAASLGKTADQLSKNQKSMATMKALEIQVQQATAANNQAQETSAQVWARKKASFDNWKDSAFGFNSEGGKIREVLRELDEEVLKLFGSNRLEDVRRIERALQDTGVTYEQINRYVQQRNNIELKGRDILSGADRDTKARLKLQRGIVDLAKEALTHQADRIEQAKKFAEEEERERASAVIATAEYQVELLEAQKASTREIFEAKRRVLELSIAEAEATKDTVKSLELQRKLNILMATWRAKDDKKKKGRGTTEAERLKATNDAIIQQRRTELEIAQLQAQLDGTAAKKRFEFARQEREIKRAALDFELAELAATKDKDRVAQIKNDARTLEILREQEKLDLEEKIALQEESNRLVAEAHAATMKKAQDEANAEARVISLQQYRLSRQAAAYQQEADLALANAKTERQRFEIQRELADRAHKTRLQQISAEWRAKEQAFDAEEARLLSQPKVDNDALDQLTHDRKIARMEKEMQVRQALSEQAARLAEEERQRLQMSMAQMMEGVSAINQLQGQITGIVSTEVGRRRAIEDEEFQAHIRGLSERSNRQLEQLDEEIKAAEGNAALQAKLRQKRNKLEEQNRKAIEQAEKKHLEKRKREEMRFAGYQLLIQSAVDAARAVSEFASYNFVQGALHVASAALNLSYGLALLSGQIPVGGGAGAGGAGGGGATGTGTDSGRSGQDLYKTPDSVPGKAAKNQSGGLPSGRAASSSNGGVVINGNISIQASGSIDKEAAEQIGLGIGKAAYSREGAA